MSPRPNHLPAWQDFHDTVELADSELVGARFQFTYSCRGALKNHVASFDGIALLTGCQWGNTDHTVVLVPIDLKRINMRPRCSDPIHVVREFWIPDSSFPDGYRNRVIEEDLFPEPNTTSTYSTVVINALRGLSAYDLYVQQGGNLSLQDWLVQGGYTQEVMQTINTLVTNLRETLGLDITQAIQAAHQAMVDEADRAAGQAQSAAQSAQQAAQSVQEAADLATQQATAQAQSAAQSAQQAADSVQQAADLATVQATAQAQAAAQSAQASAQSAQDAADSVQQAADLATEQATAQAQAAAQSAQTATAEAEAAHAQAEASQQAADAAAADLAEARAKVAQILAAITGLDPSQSPSDAIVAEAAARAAADATMQTTLDELGLELDKINYNSEIVDTESYPSINYVISPSDVKWYTASTGQKSIAIPIPENVVKIELVPTTSIMMWSLLSAYVAPTANKQNVQTIATNLEARYSSETKTTVTELSDAKYIVVRADTNNDGAGCPTIKLYTPGILSHVEEMGEDVALVKGACEVEVPIEISEVPALNCYIYANNNVPTWQNGTTQNNGKFYPVTAGEEYVIVGNSVNDGTRVAFVTDDTHATGAMGNLASGWTNFVQLSANQRLRVVAPSDAAYLFCNTHSSIGSLEPSKIARIERVNSHIVDSDVSLEVSLLLPDYVVTNPRKVDFDAIYEHEAALGGSGKWTRNNNGIFGKHKALPVNEGDIYILKLSNSNDNFFGFVTSSYSPEYTNNTTIPYVSGYDRVLGSTTPSVVVVPADAAYLILGTVNGSGEESSWSVIKVDSIAKRPSNNFTKFRFATWNIGIFKYYRYKTDHVVRDITDNEAEDAALEYRKMINSIGANILGVCEYQPKYPRSNSVGITADKIFGCFAQKQIGTYYGNAACNAVFFNSPTFISTFEKVFERTGKKEIDSSFAQRYYKDVVLSIGGIEVHVVETHLDHSYTEIRTSQMQELISAMSSYEHVIIAGDFNTNDLEHLDTEIALFTDAGYTVANNGYIGLYVTNEDGHKIDNIAVKGFAMTNINVVEDAGNLSDHWIVYCDLEMLQE